MNVIYKIAEDYEAAAGYYKEIKELSSNLNLYYNLLKNEKAELNMILDKLEKEFPTKVAEAEEAKLYEIDVIPELKDLVIKQIK